MNGNDTVEIKTAFDELIDYTVYHFSNEEKFMQKISYPMFESHKKVHENLLASVAKFYKNFQEGNIDKIRLASFLKNWLFTHIMGIDTKYAQYSIGKI